MIREQIVIQGKKLLISILIIQFSVLGLIILDLQGISTFPFRQMLTIPYLLLVPGILILGIIKMNFKGSFTTMFLYSVSLSISFIMLIGTLINTILPFLGFFKPISLMPLTIDSLKQRRWISSKAISLW